MKRRSAIQTDLFAADRRNEKIVRLGDPMVEMGEHFYFVSLALEVDRIAPRPVSPQGGRPPFPTETMVRLLFLMWLYNLSVEQMEFHLLDLISYQRFCGLTDSASIPDRTTIWTFENRICEDGAIAQFDGVEWQLLKQGYIARGSQIIDATLVPTPKQHFTKEDKEQIKQVAMPAEWSLAKRRQRDLVATCTKKNGKSHHGYKYSINVDKRYKVIRKIETVTASTHDSQQFDAVLDPANTSRDVFADKGYPSAEREAKLKAANYRKHIQRKGQRTHPLSDFQERRNRRITKTRARVEHGGMAWPLYFVWPYVRVLFR